MTGFGGSNFGKIGEAFVELTGRDEQLNAALDRGRANTEKATAQMGSSVDKNVTGSFDRAGAAIENSTAGIRKFQGALGAVVGVATGLVGIFAVISTAIIGLVALAKKFGDESERSAEEWENIRDIIRDVETSLAKQELAVSDISDAEKARLLTAIQEREEMNKLDQLYKDGVLTNEELWELKERQRAVTNAQLGLQEKQLKTQREAVKLAKEQADEAERLADALERAEKGAAQMLIIQREMAFTGADLLGPFLEDFPEAIAKMDELGKKAGEAFAKSFDDALQGQTGLQNLTGSMETMRQQILDEIQSLKLRGSAP